MLGPRRKGGGRLAGGPSAPAPPPRTAQLRGSKRPDANSWNMERARARRDARARTRTHTHAHLVPRPDRERTRGSGRRRPSRLTCLGSMASAAHVLGHYWRTAPLPPPRRDPPQVGPPAPAPSLRRRQVPPGQQRSTQPGRAAGGEMALVQFHFRFFTRTSPSESSAGRGRGWGRAAGAEASAQMRT